MMKEIRAEKWTPAEFAMTKFWERRDTMVVAGGSIPCIRELYILARKMGRLSQFRYGHLTEEDYILGNCEEKVRHLIREGAVVPGVQVVIFYLSCLDILVRPDFRDMEETLSRETGKVVRCFYRGPLGKEEKDHVDVDTFLSQLPPEKGAVEDGFPQLPPPVSDGAAVSDWLRMDLWRNVLVTPAGCRSCMVDLDMMEDQAHVYYPALEGKDFIFGMEDKTSRETADLLKDDPEASAALIGTGVPAFMGMDGAMTAGEIRKAGHGSVYFDADGFHDALYGLSRAELFWAKVHLGHGGVEKKGVVQVLGYSPLLCGPKTQYDRAISFIRNLGYEVRFDGEWEPEGLPALNWCVSGAGLLAGRWMKDILSVPLLISHPLGDHAFGSWKKQVEELLAEGKGERSLHIHNMGISETRRDRVLLLGDPVRMMGAAHYLWHRGFHHVMVAVPCWTGDTKKIAFASPGSAFIHPFADDGELEALGESWDMVLGDPWFAAFLEKGQFNPLPWGAISGRESGNSGAPLGKETTDILDSL